MLLYRKNFIYLLRVALRVISSGLLMLLFYSMKSYAVDVSLAWNPSIGASGYRVYYGNQSGNYSSNFDVGNQTSYTFSDDSDGETYYFAVTAYASETAESGFSNEVSTALFNSDNAQSSVLSNISTRAFVGTGDSVLIGGFIINGNTPKTVVVRALGESLQNAGIQGSLSDPTLELFSGQISIALNDDWANNSLAIPSSFQPSGDSESAIVVTLNPGAYTAIVRGFTGSTGIALVEVFELNSSENAILSNISTRAFVGTGDSALIGGFIINGNTPKTVVVRALGESLQNAGIQGSLSDPTLELFSGQTSIAFNDDWASNPVAIPNTFRPPGDSESAIVVTLNPGAYTAIVRGLSNSTGIALIEVFDLD